MNTSTEMELFSPTVVENEITIREATFEIWDKSIEINPPLLNLTLPNQLAERITSSRAEAWADKGAALNLSGKYDEAIQAYNKAIEIDPKNADAWEWEGDTLRAQGQIAEANDAFAKAKELGYTG